jgi:hypothetical protein
MEATMNPTVRRIVTAAAGLALALSVNFATTPPVVAASCYGDDVAVSGYYRSNGTYVAPYCRTRPNSTTADNYSTRGNVNPYTGRPGTRRAADEDYWSASYDCYALSLVYGWHC